MNEKGITEKKVDKITKLGSLLLKLLDEKGVDENTAQAALGHAWIRLLEAMGMPKKEFQILMDNLVDAQLILKWFIVKTSQTENFSRLLANRPFQ